jgi:hypothetical protein
MSRAADQQLCGDLRNCKVIGESPNERGEESPRHQDGLQIHHQLRDGLGSQMGTERVDEGPRREGEERCEFAFDQFMIHYYDITTKIYGGAHIIDRT